MNDHLGNLYDGVQRELASQMSQQESAYRNQMREQMRDYAMAKALQAKPKPVTATAGTSAWTSDYIKWTSSATNDNATISTNGAPAVPKPETNCAWLDRRVREMRVAL